MDEVKPIETNLIEEIRKYQEIYYATMRKIYSLLGTHEDSLGKPTDPPENQRHGTIHNQSR